MGGGFIGPIRCIETVRIDQDMFERQWWGDEEKS